MTVQRVPSTQRTEEPHGLDGNGTMRASDLPASTWGYPWQDTTIDTLDLDQDPPIRRTLCMTAEPGLFGVQCRDLNGHDGPHDWEADRGSPLTLARAEALREAQEDAQATDERAQEAFEGEGGPGGRSEAERPSGRLPWPRVVGRWTA